MTETARLRLPLLQPSQAQKHVTVNEAFVLLDGLAQLCLRSITQTTPPAPVDGDCYAVPAGATDAWLGQDGMVAIASNGGWSFVLPQTGWSAWIDDEGVSARYSGGAWRSGALGVGASGAGANFRTVEVEEDVPLTGGGDDMAALIPANAMVFAVSARVIVDLTGTLTSWRLGTTGADNRFGSGMGIVAGSYSTGILGAPTTYYAQTPLRFTPEGGDVSAGRLRLALCYITFEVPGV